MEGGEVSRLDDRSPTLEADPGGRFPPLLPSPARIKEELINLRLEGWLSRAEELTALEVALRVVALDPDSPTTFRTADIEPACALPLPGGTYYHVPLDNKLDDLPAFVKYKAWKIEACAQNHDHAALMPQVVKLLDEDIAANCRSELRNSISGLEEDLATIELYKKVGFCAKYRLESGIIPIHLHHNRIKFGVCDIDQHGKAFFTWLSTDQECTFDDMKSALDHYSRSSYVPRVELLPHVRSLEILEQTHKVPLSFTALLASELLADLRPIVDDENDVQVKEGDAPFVMIWESDDLMRIAYPEYSVVVEDNNETIPGPDPSPKDLDLWEVKTEQDFDRIRYLARETRKCPVLMRPWQFRFFELMWRVRSVAEY